ncbi:MAG: CBS domain-containing protein [Theionarchaea archaeon]|nr:CBS domain-containing protein [Theionarchaea archaeon]
MQVRDVMIPPQTVGPEEYATKIRAVLREKERLLVVTEKQFLGIITRQDAMLVTSTKSNLKARDIMSQPILTIFPDEEIHAAGRKMIERDVYSVCVMESSRVTGVVHMEDVIQAVHHPSPIKVCEIMTADVISCDHTEDITKVWDLMEYHNLTGIPVTREVSTSHRKYKKLVGFITRKDILRIGEIRLGGDRQRFTHPPAIEKAMTRTPKIVRPTDMVDDCVDLFKKYEIGRLPVVQNGFELIGIVDREDVLKIYV